MSLARLILIASLLLFSACGDSHSVAPNGAASYDETWRSKSSLSHSQAKVAADHAAATIVGARVWSVEETHSMEPIIWGNCYIIAEPVKVTDIKVGDIILYRRGGKVILHTCIGNVGGRLTMKGYNNFGPDKQPNFFITGEDVMGRYVGQVIFDPNKP